MKLLLLFSAFWLPIFSWAQSMPDLTTAIVSPATVLSVHDGDTITIAIPGNRPFVGSVRLKGVSSFELNTAGGKSAQANLQRIVPRGTSVRVRLTYTKEGNSIESLCRPIAEVWVEASGKSVNDLQIAYLKAHGYWGGN